MGEVITTASPIPAIVEVVNETTHVEPVLGCSGATGLPLVARCMGCLFPDKEIFSIGKCADLHAAGRHGTTDGRSKIRQ